jgi:hypothetical protein
VLIIRNSYEPLHFADNLLEFIVLSDETRVGARKNEIDDCPGPILFILDLLCPNELTLFFPFSPFFPSKLAVTLVFHLFSRDMPKVNHIPSFRSNRPPNYIHKALYCRSSIFIDLRSPIISSI